MTVLAAVDETERAKRVVEIADGLATAYDDDLIVSYVVPREDFQSHKETLEDIPDCTDVSLDREADSAATFARRVFEEVVGGAGDDVQFRGRVGDTPRRPSPRRRASTRGTW